MNYTTVGTLLRGGRAEQENVIKIARAYRINPNELLSLYGFERIPEFDRFDWSNRSPEGVAEPRAAYDTPLSDEVIQVRIKTELQVVGPNGETRPLGVEDLSPEARRLIADLFRGGALDAEPSSGEDADGGGGGG